MLSDDIFSPKYAQEFDQEVRGVIEDKIKEFPAHHSARHATIMQAVPREVEKVITKRLEQIRSNLSAVAKEIEEKELTATVKITKGPNWA